MPDALNPPPDPQDPLPEAGFLWRRLLTFTSSGALLLLLWLSLSRLPPGDVLAFAHGVMLLLALLWLSYFGGASALDITNILAVLKLRLRGPRTDDAKPPTADPPGELPASQRVRP